MKDLECFGSKCIRVIEDILASRRDDLTYYLFRVDAAMDCLATTFSPLRFDGVVHYDYDTVLEACLSGYSEQRAVDARFGRFVPMEDIVTQTLVPPRIHNHTRDILDQIFPQTNHGNAMPELKAKWYSMRTNTSHVPEHIRCLTRHRKNTRKFFSHLNSKSLLQNR